MKLREYQINCIQNARAAFAEGHKSICIVLPCRAGKSVIAANIAKNAADKKNIVLFIVHRKELCEQIRQTFTECGVDMKRCIIEMVQTISRRTGNILPPDIIITDEFHHGTAKSYRKIYEAFPEAFRIGFTATPLRLNQGGLGDVCDKLIIGVTADELIKQGFLSDYRYYNNKLIDVSGIKTKCGDYEISVIDSMTDKQVIYGGAVDNYLKFANGKKAICYCTSVKNALKLCDEFKAAGVSADFITGSQKQQERSVALQNFRDGKIKVLTSCEIISEGVDIPDCECCILIRPTKSLGLYIQQSMRCLNPLPGKTAVILDLVGNVLIHGLPTNERRWTLETQKTKKQENEIKIRTCPKCYAVLMQGKKVCDCGYDFTEEIELEETEADKAELVEFDRNIRFVNSYADCRNVAELFSVAAIKGYKPVSVYFKALEYGFTITLDDLKKIAKLSGYHWKWAEHKWKELKQA